MTASQSLAQPFGERSRRCTLADVAEYAGVSASTASRALNGRGELSDRDTRGRARGRATRSTSSRRSSPARCARARRTPSASSSPTSRARSTRRRSRARRRALERRGLPRDADGLASRPPTARSRRCGRCSPTGSTACSSRPSGIDRDAFDDVVGAARRRASSSTASLAGARRRRGVCSTTTPGIELLVDHLVEHGHRRIGAARRLADARRAASSGRAAFDAAMRAARPARPGAGIARRRRWTLRGRARARRSSSLGDRAPPTALVASSVELALGALLACRELGVAHPRRRSRSRRSTTPYFAELLDPPLTAVAYDPAEVGRARGRAARRGDARRRAEPRATSRSRSRLVARRSCGCAA